MELRVEGMSCGHCVAAVTKAVQALDPAARVDVDLAAQRVRVETTRERADVAQAIDAAGYAAT